MMLRPNTPTRLRTPSPLTSLVAALALACALTAPTIARAADATGTGGVSVATTSTTAAAPATKSNARARGAQVEVDTVSDPADQPRSVAKGQVRRAQTLLRLTATGSNDAPTRRTVKRFQRLRGLTAHGIIDIATYLQIKDAFALLETGGAGVDLTQSDNATGGATTARATTPFVAPANLAAITASERAILDTISQCESKGDPTSISSDGTYRGKYQFDRTTWKTVGGTGDPAAATEAEQDQRAAILLRQRGTAPWPLCGRDAA